MPTNPHQTVYITQPTTPPRFRRRYLTLPDRFAPAGSNLIVTMGPTGFLLLFSEKFWVPQRDKILLLPGDDPRNGALKRVIVGNARTETVDKRHRVVVANDLCEFAQLGKIAYWVPVANHVEVWNPELFSPDNCCSWLNYLPGK